MRLVVASHVIDDDVCAGLRHCDRNRLADAGIGACDERLLTGKRHACYGRPPDNPAFPDVHFALPICMRENYRRGMSDGNAGRRSFRCALLIARTQVALARPDLCEVAIRGNFPVWRCTRSATSWRWPIR